MFWQTPSSLRSSEESASSGGAGSVVHFVVGQEIERDADRLGEPQRVVEARPRFPLEDSGDLRIAHPGEPRQLLAVKASAGHQKLEFLFEFHDPTIGCLPDAGERLVCVFAKKSRIREASEQRAPRANRAGKAGEGLEFINIRRGERTWVFGARRGRPDGLDSVVVGPFASDRARQGPYHSGLETACNEKLLKLQDRSGAVTPDRRRSPGRLARGSTLGLRRRRSNNDTHRPAAPYRAARGVSGTYRIRNDPHVLNTRDYASGIICAARLSRSPLDDVLGQHD